MEKKPLYDDGWLRVTPYSRNETELVFRANNENTYLDVAEVATLTAALVAWLGGHDGTA